MESALITKLQNQLKQVGLSKVEKPANATGINADERNKKRQEEYKIQMYDAKQERFNKQLRILSGVIPETPEEYVELFNFMEMYHGQLTNGFDKVEKIPSATDAIDDKYFLKFAGGRNGIIMYNIDDRTIGKDPSTIYDEYINKFPVFLMKDRHYKNAVMRFPDDSTIAGLCAAHEEEIKMLKENIIKRFDAVKEENISRVEILKKQMAEKDLEKEKTQKENSENGKKSIGKIIKIVLIIIAVIIAIRILLAIL